jgi:hypothetical protein
MHLEMKNIIEELTTISSKTFLTTFFYSIRVRSVQDFSDTFTPDTQVYMLVRTYKSLFYKSELMRTLPEIQRLIELLDSLFDKITYNNVVGRHKELFTFIIKETDLKMES